MMLSKCYTHYASKFGKLSSGHRTGKGQFSLQSQRMFNAQSQKNVQTTVQLHVHLTCYHNSAQNSPNQASTVHELRFKLDLEKAEEPEINLPTSIGS